VGRLLVELVCSSCGFALLIGLETLLVVGGVRVPILFLYQDCRLCTIF